MKKKMTAEDKALGDAHSWCGWGAGGKREDPGGNGAARDSRRGVPLVPSAAPPLLPPFSPMSWAKLG